MKHSSTTLKSIKSFNVHLKTLNNLTYIVNCIILMVLQFPMCEKPMTTRNSEELRESSLILPKSIQISDQAKIELLPYFGEISNSNEFNKLKRIKFNENIVEKKFKKPEKIMFIINFLLFGSVLGVLVCMCANFALGGSLICKIIAVALIISISVLMVVQPITYRKVHSNDEISPLEYGLLNLVCRYDDVFTSFIKESLKEKGFISNYDLEYSYFQERYSLVAQLETQKDTFHSRSKLKTDLKVF